MVRFKQLMGFLLMATVLWLLWVLGNQVGVEGVVWTGAFLLGLGLACWVWGQWGSFLHPNPAKLLARAVALILVLGSYVTFVHPLLAAEQTLAEQTTESELDWQPFSAAHVEGVGRGWADGFYRLYGRVVLDVQSQRAGGVGAASGARAIRRAQCGPSQSRLDQSQSRDHAALARLWTLRGASVRDLSRRSCRPALVVPEVITAEMVIEKLDAAAALAADN